MKQHAAREKRTATTQGTIAPRLMTVRAVARRLRCGVEDVISLCEQGFMPRPRKVLGKNRWRETAITDWITEDYTDCWKAGESHE